MSPKTERRMAQMTGNEILSGESVNLEYKEDIPAKTDRWMKTVVAFANGNGGRIVFGIKDQTKTVIGFKNEEIPMKIDMITNAIWSSCEPKIPAEVYPYEIEGKTIIIADIPRGTNLPYSLRGSGIWNGTFLRIAGTTRLAPEYMIKEMTLESMNQSFDRRKTERTLTPEEIDTLCGRLYQHAINSVSPIEQENIKKIGRSQLISCGLIIEEGGKDYASNGYQLLDGAGFYEDAVIQCARFRGTTRSIFIDRKEYSGPIDEQVESALQFVLNYLSIGSRIVGAGRHDFYELPYNSIREMIANAVCHRSYLAPEKIQVALYDDRLEVTSPGMLSRDLTIEKMKSGRSKLRNKGIASVFSYLHLIEGWGSGIPKILEEAKEYGLREPELIDMDGAFRINLYRRPFEFDRFGVVDPRENVIRETPAPYETVPSRITTGLANTGESPEETVLSMIRRDPGITQETIAGMLNISTRTVKRIMHSLQEQNKLIRSGSTRKGIWIANDN